MKELLTWTLRGNGESWRYINELFNARIASIDLRDYDWITFVIDDNTDINVTMTSLASKLSNVDASSMKFKTLISADLIDEINWNSSACSAVFEVGHNRYEVSHIECILIRSYRWQKNVWIWWWNSTAASAAGDYYDNDNEESVVDKKDDMAIAPDSFPSYEQVITRVNVNYVPELESQTTTGALQWIFYAYLKRSEYCLTNLLCQLRSWSVPADSSKNLKRAPSIWMHRSNLSQKSFGESHLK